MDVEILVDPSSQLGSIDRRIYSQFIEHLGRCIYGGIWVGEDPRIENIKGFRKDVLEAVKALKPPLVRWPGGNFASNYHWTDGIGPKNNRPKKFDMAWGMVDSNEFGTCEFIEWCKYVGAQPYIIVNAGNGSPEEAARWVEFCNLSVDTHYTSLRKSAGFIEPFNVKLWGVGNELYGDWQVGFCTDGKECARRTIEFVNEMKKVDPYIEIVAVGSDTDMEWNIDMVKYAGKYFEYLSIHKYLFTDGTSYEDLIIEPFIWERLLRSIYEIINITTQKIGLKKELKIAFDEWNVWYSEAKPPELYQVTSLKDGIFTALVLNSLQRLCREVPIACFAQTVNVLPLIGADDEGRMYVNPQYLAFKLYVDSTQDIAVKCLVDSSTTFYSRKLNQSIDYCDAVASISKEGDRIAIQLVNMSPSEDAICKFRIRSFKPSKVEVKYLRGESLEDKNNFDNPDKVRIESGKAIIKDNSIELDVRRHSVYSLVIEGSRL